METFGIIILSHVSIKSENSHRSETITQGLFGEIFKVLEIRNDWTKIQLLNDSYIGFIQNQQWVEIEDFNNIQFYCNTKDQLKVKRNQIILHLPIGARIWKKKVKHSILSEFRFSKKAKFKISKSILSQNQIIISARKFLGSPYLWGGKTTAGIDCSGLVQVVFQVIGILLPRDAYQQAEIGQIISIHDCKIGDLAYFTQKTDRITHVGIIYEVKKDEIKIIHASAFVRIDTLDEKGISYINLQNEIVYSHQLKFIKRVLLS